MDPFTLLFPGHGGPKKPKKHDECSHSKKSWSKSHGKKLKKHK
ncbi:hypothetical protein ACFQH9_03610 [Pseudonocardia lutea]|jgi:hypothetical protein|uniref:Uncharacterized protein n=1 Tax=Pseudonocardia lutea TaxID=2172015 RepID=A0ABW1I3Q3_9PSEU